MIVICSPPKQKVASRKWQASFPPYRHEPDPRSWCKRTCPDFWGFFIVKIMQLMAEHPSNQLSLVVFFPCFRGFQTAEAMQISSIRKTTLEEDESPIWNSFWAGSSLDIMTYFHQDTGSYSFAPFDCPKMRDLQKPCIALSWVVEEILNLILHS